MNIFNEFCPQRKENMLHDPMTKSEPPNKRSFVFLQGPTSGVMRDLGRALATHGHDVLKINFCPGDALFWRGYDTLTYRAKRKDWPEFLRQVLVERSATDIVYFADRFPYHRLAQDVARALGVRPISLEYGYLRPDWLILEEGGQSTFSHFHNSREAIQAAAKTLPKIDMTPKFAIPEGVEAICETSFHLSNAFLAPIFTANYAPDRYYPVLREYLSYAPRMIRRGLNAKRAAKSINALQNSNNPKFLIPLQMQNDYQLRHNAPSHYQDGFISEIMESFKNNAPRDAQLVFKLHPMDNGLERWDRRVLEFAKAFGLSERVHFLDGGDLGALFAMSSGCVVINSTMGLRALGQSVPTKVMGVAVYDIEGLTDQASLDEFWQNPTPPEAAFLADFLRAIACGIHVRGAIYGRKGRAEFVKNALSRLQAPQLHRAGLYLRVPPRLFRAKALAIEVPFLSDCREKQT
ncbi:MAG: capsular polysaccharide export protein [Halocynthiibacter sp.]